jgi:membrane protein DedA with SNARE-associated domain
VILALAEQSFLSSIYGRLGYGAPFLILVGAGAGLPVPEEVTMVGSGYLLHQGLVSMLPIMVTCWVATLIGDSIPFWLGRTLGPKALKLPFASRILHPERFTLIEKRFEKHGSWAIFTCRFLPGVRLPGFFSAGTLGMSYGRFLLADASGALIMVPMYILIGKAFGKNIGRLEAGIKDSTETLGFVLVLVLAFVCVRMLVHRRERQVAKLGLSERHAAESQDSDPPTDPK